MIVRLLQFLCALTLAGGMSSALAETYDPLLLRAQASIFPKIVLLDQDLENKIYDDAVVISIVSTQDDISAANDLRGNILDKYKEQLGDKKLIVNVVSFFDFNNESPATAYILLQADNTLFGKVVDHATSNKRIVFGYSYADLENGALISLHVKEKTYIYVNKSMVKEYGVNFLPVFYNIIKVL